MNLALGHDKAQNIIDQITQAYESGGGPPPGGFGFTAASLGGPPPGYGELISILVFNSWNSCLPLSGAPPPGFGGKLAIDTLNLLRASLKVDLDDNTDRHLRPKQDQVPGSVALPV